MFLTWNRAAQAVRRATNATLSIQDCAFRLTLAGFPRQTVSEQTRLSVHP
jgi:hypothetical protein